MATLSTRNIHKIGIDPPQPANPDDHDLYRYDSQDEDECDETDSECEYQASGTELESEVSDAESIDSATFFSFRKLKKNVNSYTVILQEEEFITE